MRKGQADQATKADFELALDSLASHVAEKLSISKAQAYQSVLCDTPEGSALYTGFTTAKSGGVPSGACAGDRSAAIRKARPGPPVLVDSESPSEVLRLIEKGERVSKSALEVSLDALASKLQTATGQSFYKCYSEIITNSAAGQALYRAYDQLVRADG